jgi:hypothetical protein
MRGEVVEVSAEDELSPSLLFSVRLENPRDAKVLLIGIASRVVTSPPMKLSVNLGRLTPTEALMWVGPRDSSTFTFRLDMDRAKLSRVEEARVDDVWLTISMSALFLEVDEGWAPRRVGWDTFGLTSAGRYAYVKIPESDWIKLRDQLGYGRARVVEVGEETYRLLEEYMRRVRARSLDEAIHTAVLAALRAGPGPTPPPKPPAQ